MLIKRSLSKQNNNYNKDSKPLLVYKKLSATIYVPTKRYLILCANYARATPFTKIWLVIWLFNFNIFALFLSAIGTAFYFFVTFDIVALYNFLYGAVVKLKPAFSVIPFWIWILVTLWWLDKWRKGIGIMRLRHMEKINTTFILDRSICSMLVGTMGKGKTTLITDMSLSTEAIFRNKAYDMMLEIDLKFPHFPYIVLENELKAEIEKGNVFNLANCGGFIEEKKKLFNKVLRKIRK
jgi:hypothetical protein